MLKQSDANFQDACKEPPGNAGSLLLTTIELSMNEYGNDVWRFINEAPQK